MKMSFDARNRGEQGFMLVEYMSSMSLIMLVLVFMFSMVRVQIWSEKQHQDNCELQYSARTAMQWIGRDLREAGTVQVSENGAKLLIYSDDGSPLSYYADKRQVYRHGAAKNPVIMNAVSLRFRAISPRLVEVKLELERGKTSLTVQSAFATRISS